MGFYGYGWPAMTSRQREVFNFVKRFISEKGYSPSYDEIGENIKTVKSNAFRLVNELISQNYLKHKEFSNRSLEIVQHICPHCKEVLL